MYLYTFEKNDFLYKCTGCVCCERKKTLYTLNYKQTCICIHTNLHTWLNTILTKLCLFSISIRVLYFVGTAKKKHTQEVIKVHLTTHREKQREISLPSRGNIIFQFIENSLNFINNNNRFI